MKTKSSVQESVPLCVDLDGTLLKTDTLLESLFFLLRKNPLILLSVLLTLRKGRAFFKASVAKLILPDIALLPTNKPLLDWLWFQYKSGRRLILVTAANQLVAKAVAMQVGIFDEILASDDKCNLKGVAKGKRLISRFGEKGFDYAGNSKADIAVWKHASQAIVIGGSSLVKNVENVCRVSEVFSPKRHVWYSVVRAFRLHQWTKNILLFIPLLASHQINNSNLINAHIAFFVFGLTASAVYLLNDLLDLSNDRCHPEKKNRPFASGDLPLSYAIFMIPLLLLTAGLLCIFFLSIAFSTLLVIYFSITTLYSFKFKNVAILDVMVLTVLYTVRVIAGGAAVTIAPSFWLLAFSMFLFFSLALVKRYSELLATDARKEISVPGRAWCVNDLQLIGVLGVSSSNISILVIALYIDSDQAQQLYTMPQILWLVCPLLLYWTSFVWFKAYRGQMNEDPIVFALRDPFTLMVGATMALICMSATLGLGFLGLK